MKKFILFLLTVFFAYLTAFYTTGKKNGYEKIFDFDFLIQKLNTPKTESEAPEKTNIETGKYYLEAEEYDSALDAFFDALDENDNSESNYYIGHTYLMQEDYYNALEYLNTAIDLDAKNDKAYLDKGIVEYEQGYYSEAINDLFFSTELNSENAKPYYYLSLCYEQNKQLEVALQSVETAVKYDSLYSDAWFKAGYLAFNLDSFNRAKYYYTKLLNIEPEHKYGLVNLGLTYSYLNENDSAILYYDKVIEIYPKYDLAYNNKGYIYQKQKRYKEAIELYNTAFLLNNKNSRSLWNRGDCLFLSGKYNEALKDFKKVYELDKDSYNVLFRIGECYEKLGLKKDALDYYQQYQSVASIKSIYFNKVIDKIKKLKK
ncbi:MAG: tetratricopeptide repeat protein [Bacteroidales bacterium]|nr:tetratricopeptide repeat protein [Bacteroidales bacterium]